MAKDDKQDFTTNENGDLVFTREYLLSRGNCCQSGCQNCPYGYHEKIDPNYPAELQSPWEDQES